MEHTWLNFRPFGQPVALGSEEAHTSCYAGIAIGVYRLSGQHDVTGPSEQSDTDGQLLAAGLVGGAGVCRDAELSVGLSSWSAP